MNDPPFPFEPYDVQRDLMRAVRERLDAGGVAIVESPTGTGKSLSLICSALHWLLDSDHPYVATMVSASLKRSSLAEHKPEAHAWIDSFFKEKNERERIDRESRRRERRRMRMAKLCDKLKHKETIARESRVSSTIKKRASPKQVDKELGDGRDDMELIIHWSDDKCTDTSTRLDAQEWKRLIDQEDGFIDTSSEDDEVDPERDGPLQIIYCTRTHSQIRQFLREVRKTSFADRVRCVPLSSRRQLCVNPSVQSISSVQSMNERCLELRSAKYKPEQRKVMRTSLCDGSKDKLTRVAIKSSETGCPYLGRTSQRLLADHALESVMDLEELHETGERIGACSYYGARLAAKSAHLVVMPYSFLLHESQREALGINLRGSVIIIDESHNLVDAINALHSAQVSYADATAAHAQLSCYLQRFETRLNPLNALFVGRVLFILERLMKSMCSLTDDRSDQQTSTEVLSSNDFLFRVGIDNQNLFDVARFLTESNLINKLKGFVNKENSRQKALEPHVTIHRKGRAHIHSEKDTASHTFGCMQRFKDFFLALTHADERGRVILEHNLIAKDRSCIRYIMLSPSASFRPIVEQARSVILAGGTMQPYAYYIQQLFSADAWDNKPPHVSLFSCGHVVSPENVLALALTHGPSGVPLDFTFSSRSSPELLDELNRTLTNICSIVPGGVVCFFSSYAYEQHVFEHWKARGLLDGIAAKKPIFRDDATQSNVLESYASAITCDPLRGALLSCVVGGSLSEGINFSDNLARCVIMVGMPYASTNDAELKERINYLDKQARLCNSVQSALSGRMFYETLCMRAVNQSIGRSIRHRDDYATIILLDVRYSQERIINQIPGWIRKRLANSLTFGPAFAKIASFFKSHRV